MALAFFRRHQKTVLIPMVVVLIITFVLWGAFTRSDQDQGGALDVVGTIKGKNVTYAEATAFMRRYRALMGADLFGGRGASEAWRMRTALQFMALLQEAQTNQIGISDTEIRRILQQWARARRNAQDPKRANEPMTVQDFRQIFQGYGTSADSLRRAVRERTLIDRQLDLIQAGAEVSAFDEYLLYAKARERVRVWYREFKVDDFRDDIEPPTDEEITEYYNVSRGQPENDPDSLYRDPHAQLDLLFAETQVFQEKVEITDEKLKKLYDETKERRFREGEDAEGNPKYKPLKEVKGIVERQLRGQEGGKKAEQALANAKEEFDKQMKVLQEAQQEEAEPKEDQPPLAARIDLKKIAKTFELQAIETKLLPRSTFSKVNGIPKLGSAYSLSSQVFVEDIEKRKEGLSDLVKAGKGWVAFRVLAFEPARVMEPAEARSTIVDRLTDDKLRAAAKAKADAFKDTLALYLDPQAQLALLFAETQVFEKQVEVTDQKLKNLYDETKESYRAGEDTEDNPKYKPLKEVKGIVERQLRGQEGVKKAKQALEKAKAEFEKQLKVIKEAKAPPNKDQPPLAASIDLKEIAKTFGLQAFETEMLPRSDFSKDDGIPQLGYAGSLSDPVFVEAVEKRQETFSDPVKVRKGWVAFRVLRRERDWFTLEDTGLGSPRHRIARSFDETALGEVHAPYEDTDPARPPFLVGMVVERDVPNRQAFDSDPLRTATARQTAFNRMRQNPSLQQQLRYYRDLKETWEQNLDPDADRSDAAFRDGLLQRWRSVTRRLAWEHYEFVKRYEIRVSDAVSRKP